jgi:hypothetical protein
MSCSSGFPLQSADLTRRREAIKEWHLYISQDEIELRSPSAPLERVAYASNHLNTVLYADYGVTGISKQLSEDDSVCRSIIRHEDLKWTLCVEEGVFGIFPGFGIWRE